MKLVILLAILLGTAAFIRLGVYLGSRWIDKMLHFEEPDPSKPIVRRHQQEQNDKA